MLQLPLAELDVRPGRVVEWRPVPVPSHPASRAREAAPGAVSYNQEQHFTLARAPGGAVFSCTVVGFEIEGRLDEEAFGSALTRFVCRHEVLRCAFRQRGEEVTGTVHAPEEVTLARVEAGSAASPEALRAILEPLFRRIDTVSGPLFVMAAAVRKESTTVHLAFDHLVYDGQSAAVAVHDIATAYAALSGGEEPALPPTGSHPAFGREQRRLGEALGAGDERLEYWREFTARGGGLYPPFPLDLGVAPGRMYPPVNETTRLLDGPSAARLEARCRAWEGNLCAGALAALGVALREEGGPETFRGIMPVSERGRGPDAYAMGWFANPVPIEFAVAGDKGCAQIVAGARAACVAAIRHAGIPFVRAGHLLAPPDASPESGPGARPVCLFSYSDFTRAPGAEHHVARRARKYTWLSHTNGICLWLHRAATGLYVNIVHADTPRARRTVSTLRATLARTLGNMAGTGEF